MENIRNLRCIRSFFLSDCLLTLEIQLVIPLVIHSHCDDLRAKKISSDGIDAEFN